MLDRHLEWDDTLNEEIYRIRRHLHRHPELSFKEFETSKYIRSILESWGIPYRQVVQTGLIVDIYGEKGEGPNLAIRADIDALPIMEQSGLSFSSERKNVMHACGHDGHTAILLGVVRFIWKNKAHLTGMIRCIFEPGEEEKGAAEKLMEEGVLHHPDIDEIVALHMWPNLPAGSVGVRPGPMTAAAGDFKITVSGKSGHAARPHEGVDAITAAARIVQSLEYLSVKWKNPVEPLVIHVGKINGGTARNIIADQAILEGTIRTAGQALRDKVKLKFPLFVKSISDQLDTSVQVDFIDGMPGITNDPHVTEKIREAAVRVVGEAHVHILEHPSMGGDDFGFFAEKVRSTYFRLGTQEPGEESFDLHHPKFQFDEKVLPVGAHILVQYIFGQTLSR